MFRRAGSIKLIDAFGIRIGVDVSWFLILFVLIYLLSGPFRTTLHSSDGVAYLTTVASVLLLFASLIVHELGHALVARREGVEVKRIDLFLFGGITQMGRDSTNPGEEFRIGAAGPAATLAVIILCLIVDLAVVGPHRLLDAALLKSDLHVTPVLLCMSWLLVMNVIVFVFNLMPAFPLDGGRIARAIVWRLTGDQIRATRVAARLGQGFGWLLGAAGLVILIAFRDITGIWFAAMGYLIAQAARGTLAQTAITQSITGVRVSDIMDRQPVAIPAETPLAEALDSYFLRYGWAWFPVVDAGGHFLGIVRRERAEAAQDAGEGWLTVGAVVDDGGAGSWRVDEDRPLGELLNSEPLGRLGALMAVDREGMLRGVITIEHVRRALQSALGSPAQ
ncbi:MAG TPA: site-2 protease family protein [Solirubrobacteraceae bacterium]|jgi:Zn-dependent protease|nr:site-2 protease family protein [Solirubrobacteraceae bacterium]